MDFGFGLNRIILLGLRLGQVRMKHLVSGKVTLERWHDELLRLIWPNIRQSVALYNIVYIVPQSVIQVMVQCGSSIGL